VSCFFPLRRGLSDGRLVKVPCGRCRGCRLDRARDWALRCVHEAKMHEENSFVTLTYRPEDLPAGGSLVKADMQGFMKRLRKSIEPKVIRFYGCGEYGSKLSRPHYHILVFGYDFPDKEIYRDNGEIKIYTSRQLEKLWTNPKTGKSLGFHTIGELTFDSAAYVARYITKKITGEHAVHHYNSIDYTTGEVLAERLPEYTTMSRRPGIGKKWLEKYTSDVYNFDHIILKGKELKPPKYYDKLYAESHPEEFVKIKIDRKEKNEVALSDQTTERLEVREQIAKLKLRDKQQRSYENEQD